MGNILTNTSGMASGIPTQYQKAWHMSWLVMTIFFFESVKYQALV